MKTMLVVGASGTIGSAACEHFADLPGWRTIGLSRRRPGLGEQLAYEHIALDLTDPEGCVAVADRFAGVTHVIYAALFEKPGLVAGWYEQDQMHTNLAMMRNIMDPLFARAGGLQHISMMQGTKAYGAHHHRIAIPAREDRPRDAHENFYWLHEDFLRGARRHSRWSFTIWRPQIVFGGAIGVAMNLIPILGVYAALCRELKLPFLCPGDPDTIFEAIDARLIARALAWGAENPAARDETFNVTNGDVFVWRNIWPAIADAVGLEPVFGDPLSLSTFLPAQTEAWDRIVRKSDLRRLRLDDILGQSHHYADLLFCYGAKRPLASTLVSTVKLRQAGFADCIDTEEMLRFWFNELAERRVLPRP